MVSGRDLGSSELLVFVQRELHACVPCLFLGIKSEVFSRTVLFGGHCM